MSGSTQPTQRDASGAVVVKSGGSLIDSEESMASLCEEIAALSEEFRFVVVNGGGREIDRLCASLSIPVQKVSGLRVTTPEVLSVVQMALAKSSNSVAARLNSLGVRSAPLPAFAAGTVVVEKRGSGQHEDLGLVGKVVSVDCSLLNALQCEGVVPVIYPIAGDRSGSLYNVNADEIASGVSSAMGAQALLLMTDVEGVFVNGSPRGVLTTGEMDEYAGAGWFKDGMLPKLEAASNAARGGVSRVCILDGRRKGVLRGFLKEGSTNGTEIQK